MAAAAPPDVRHVQRPAAFRARVWAAVLYAGAYARGVEKAHGLPGGVRNLPEGRAGRRRYRDVRYRRWRLVVELDGRAAHPEEDREHDDLRDNELVAQEGTRTLRYGWRSVVTRPCATAAQVAAVLGAGGWTGGE